MTPAEKAEFDAKKTIYGPASFALRHHVFSGFSSPETPLKAGDVLATFPASESHDRMGFSFDVAINEPDILVGTPLFILLRDISSQIYRVIESFAPCL
jgi:hypothetical protein